VARRLLPVLTSTLLFVLPSILGADPGQLQEVSRESIEAAIARVRPALVQLAVVTQQYSDGRAVRFPSAGSGVVVTRQGHVLTNFHVAGKSVRIRATLATGEELPADIVAQDPLTDLSVLRLRSDAEFSPVEFSPAAPEVGQPVLALGNPLTLSSSVTLGIISNARRVFTDFTGTRLEDLDLDGEPTGLFTLWLQHDALILPGNSGGPLVDLDGRLVGINELGGSGIGFAIPAAMARRVLASALAEGRVRRAEIGVSVLPVTKLGRSDGALVASVHPGSPADRAGLQPGDVLLSLGGEAADVRFFEQVPELYQRIADLTIGEPAALEIERHGERQSLSVVPVELDEAVGREAEVRELGATVQEVTTAMARQRQVTPRSGLLVTSLRPGQALANARPAVQPGDLLTALAGRPVTSIDELRSQLAGLSERDLLVELLRDDQKLVSVARLDGSRALRSGGELPKAWLGVETQVVTAPIAEAIGRPALRGFRVTQVLPWSDAEAAGLQVGDVIRQVGDRAVTGEREQDAENLRRAIEELDIGDRVVLSVDREGETLGVPVVLEPRPKSSGEMRQARQEELGFSVRDLTVFDRIEYHWGRDQKGVYVSDIVPGSWAQVGGLEPSDLVLSVGGVDVPDVAAFEKRMAAVMKERPPVVEVFLRRGARTHFVFIEPSWGIDGAAKGAS